MFIRGKGKQIEKILLIIVVLILAILLACVFYRQSISYNSTYQSDLPEHILFARESAGYSILYWLMGICLTVFKSTWSIAVLESGLVIGTVLLTGALLRDLTDGAVSYSRATFLAIPLTFLTGIYIPAIYEHFYTQQLITQPYHNITYYGMRVCSVAVMIIFVRIFNNYLRRISPVRCCLLSLTLLVSTAIKPNFFLGFSFTLLLFLLKDFVKYRFEKTPFTHMFIMGISVLPSAVILLMQAGILYGDAESGGSGIAIIMGSTFVRHGIKATLLKLICSLIFPLIIYWINRKNIEKSHWFIFIMFVVQLAVCIIFGETGKRMGHGNFYWGLYCAGFFLFISALSLCVREWKNMKATWKGLSGILVGAHFASGLAYFVTIVRGADYLV